MDEIPAQPSAPEFTRGASKLARVGAFLVVTLLGAGGVWAASRYERDPPRPPEQTPGIQVNEQSVTLEKDAPQWRHVKLGKVVPAIEHMGPPFPARVKIDERRSSRVGVPFDGRVVAVHVELGQRVKSGEALFTFTSATLAELNGEREKAAVELEAAKKALARVQEMVQAGVIPAKEEIAATVAVKQAEVADKLAEGKLAAMRAQGSAGTEFTVKAAREGVIVEKNVLYGQEVVHGGTDPLMVIADLSTVWIVAELFEADAANVREGTKVLVSSPSIPELHAEGTVELVSAVVDAERYTVPVRIKLPNKDGHLRPNLFCRVQFLITPPKDAVEVATSAVITNGADQFVYVQPEPGRFERRKVIAGSGRGTSVPVLQGLAVGEVVVEDGALLLENQIQLSQ